MTHAVRPFEVLFLTNFSESCHRAIPALARMCDEFDLRLTILHTYRDTRRMREKESSLHSFFPDVNDEGRCRRRLVPGTPLDGVRRMRHEGPVDLVVAPAGDPRGLSRVGHRSLRARLTAIDGTPMWTIGNGTECRRLARPVRRVACALELGRSGRAHLKLACQYARAQRASVQLIHVSPDIHEGNLVLLATSEPFDPEAAADEMYRIAGPSAPEPEIYVTDRAHMARLLARCDADVVFLDAERWIHQSWIAPRVNRLANSLPCPAVYVDADRQDVDWQLMPNPNRVVPPGLVNDAPLAAAAGS